MLLQRRYMDCLIEFGVIFLANCIADEDIEVQREAVAAAHDCVSKVATRVKEIYATELASYLRHENQWVRDAALQALDAFKDQAIQHTDTVIEVLESETTSIMDRSDTVEAALKFLVTVATHCHSEDAAGEAEGAPGAAEAQANQARAAKAAAAIAKRMGSDLRWQVGRHLGLCSAAPHPRSACRWAR